MKGSVIASVLFAVTLAGRLVDEPPPVTRVVELLDELKSRIESDEATEQAGYDKFACWCEEMTQKKAHAIETVREELRTTGHTILRLKGTVAVLVSEISELLTSIKENEEAQAQATAIREKGHTAFVAEKMELEQAINALEKAVIVLRDATAPASLRQQEAVVTKRSSPAAVALMEVQNALEKLPKRVQPEVGALLALKTATTQGYAPQSQTVQGILTDMYHTFANDLETQTQEEATASRKFEDLIASYAAELVTLKATLAKKEEQKTEAETMLADAIQSFSDSEAQLKADVKFFDATKASCEAKSDDWAARKELRQQELAGIAKALEILTSDDAKELFAKSIKPGLETFLQVGSVQGNRMAPALKASDVLQSLARKGHNVQLATLAATIRTSASTGQVGHFDEVIKSIDAVIATLETEGAADLKKQDECKDQFTELDSNQKDLKWKIEKSTAKIEKLEALIAAKEEEKTQTLAAIKDVTDEMKAMEDQRKTENEDFLTAKSDDEKAIELLEAAKKALSSYHAEHGSRAPAANSSLLQREDPKKEYNSRAGMEALPDAKLSKKDNRETEGKGIVSILMMIIEDLQKEVSNGQSAEEAAQVDFEKRMGAAKKLESDLKAKDANLDSVIADKNGDVDSETTLKEDNAKELKTEEDEEAAMKPDCDFMIKNIGSRREKRTREIEGLTQAKDLLAGLTAAGL